MTVYRHYKGGLYELVTEAQHSETNERMIVYKNLRTGETWVRPAAMFHQELEPGKRRFEVVSETLTSPLKAAVIDSIVQRPMFVTCDGCKKTYSTEDPAEIAVHTECIAQDPRV
jgi:hypothetical protein